MSKNTHPYNYPSNPCKLDSSKDCFTDLNHCEDCSRNPNRFDSKSITKGQMIYLLSRGYSEEELLNWSFKQASSEISRLKS